MHSVSLHIIGFHRVYNKNNTTGALEGAGTSHPSGAPMFTPSIFNYISFHCMSNDNLTFNSGIEIICKETINNKANIHSNSRT
jgi:hypothetical protein